MKRLLACLATATPLFALVASSSFAEGFNPGVNLAELTSRVEYVRNEGGRLVHEFMNRSELLSRHKDAINLDGQHYYDQVGTINADLIDACLAAPGPARVSVSYSRNDLCRRRKIIPDYPQVITAKYRLSRRSDGQIGVGIHVRGIMQADSDAETRMRINMELRSCENVVIDYWARYGIAMNLHLDSSDSPRYGTRPDFEPKLHGVIGHSNTENFYWGGLQSGGIRSALAELYRMLERMGSPPAESLEEYTEAGRKEEFCRMITHEIGHYLGFPDEYALDECPDRRTVLHGIQGGPSNLMDDTLGSTWSNTEVYPWDMRMLIRPLCPELL